MPRATASFSTVVHGHIQALTCILLVVLALASLGLTLAATAGVVGWLELELAWDGAPLPQAGIIVQVALTAFLVGLCFFLPMHGRVMRLETSHRNFAMTMDDVARAYYASHAADRAGFFTMSSEFDSIKERILFLRDHPELARLEPDILEIAAQMSHQSRDLAEIYSDENVDRARLFLKQRMQEAESTRRRIEQAMHTVRETRRWLDDVELEESVVDSQLQMLREELESLLPRLKRRPNAGALEPVPLRAAAE